jgi:O-antigen ligase
VRYTQQNSSGSRVLGGPAFPPSPQRSWSQPVDWASSQGAQFPPAARSGIFNIVLFTVCLLIITHLGRPFEKVLVGLRIPAVICSFGVIVALASGSLRHLFSSRIGQALLVLVVWMNITVPFSFWRGGSAEYLLWYCTFWMTLLILVASALRSPRDILRLGWVAVIACLFNIITGAQDSYGRLAASGTFGNSDDVALMAGFIIPFLSLGAWRIGNPFLRYPVLLIGNGYLLIAIGRTATRTAILAITAMMAIYFFRSNGRQKVSLILVSLIAFVGLIMVLPSEALKRLATITDAFAEQRRTDGTTEASASAAERRDLLRDALSAVESNPIFGVGAGQFMDYRFQVLHKHFLPSHNTFAQIAAETGIPGLLAYVGFLLAIYLSLRRLRKMLPMAHPSEQVLIGQIITTMEAALGYFVVCATFMTCDRHPQQFLLGGMVIALETYLFQQTRYRVPVTAASQAPRPMQRPPMSRPPRMVPSS